MQSCNVQSWTGVWSDGLSVMPYSSWHICIQHQPMPVVYCTIIGLVPGLLPVSSHLSGMGHTVIWDVPYGNICVKYVGLASQDHIYIYIYIYGVYTVFWQGNHQIYGHIRCINTVLANPINTKYAYNTMVFKSHFVNADFWPKMDPIHPRITLIVSSSFQHIRCYDVIL